MSTPAVPAVVPLVRSPRAAVRLRAALEWVRAQPSASDVLIVGPSLEAGRELLVRAMEGMAGAGSLGWRRTTLPLLAERLAEVPLAEDGKVRVTAAGAEAVAARVVAEAARAGTLGRYTPVADTPGFVRALAGCLAEIRLTGLGARHIRPVAPELAGILTAFRAALAEAGLADAADVLEVAAAEASKRESPHPLLDLPTLLLDVPVESEAERRFLEAVVRRAPRALATIPAGDRRTLAWLQGSPARDAAGEAEAGAADEDADGGAGAVADGSLARLQAHLFEDASPPPSEEDDTLSLFSAPGESRECVEIARKILAAAAAGVRFDRMAILLRAPAEYRAHLEEALDRASVPAWFDHGVIRPDPAGRAFLALLRCRAQGYSARRFAEYLSLGEVPDEAPGTVEGSLRAPRRWERLIVEASVVGGIDRWRRRLDGLAEAFRLEREALEREAAEEGGVPPEAAAEGLERRIADLERLRDYALPLLSELERLPARARWQAWLEGLSALADRSLRSPERVLALLAELAPLGPVGPVDLAEVIRVLSAHLLELNVRQEGPRYGRVFVGPTEAARGRGFDLVFVPGLADRVFPRKVSEEPVLLDEDRRAVEEALANGTSAGAGAGASSRAGGEPRSAARRLRTSEDRVAAEQLALRLAAGAATRRIVLSYPRLDLGQSRPRVPSFYALEALRSSEGKLPLFDDLRERADQVTEARVGWPAPREREEAIDEAEFDLAVLESLHAGAPTTGAGHYLLSANPHLGRALRSRAYRWQVRRWSRADGLVLPERPGANEGSGANGPEPHHAAAAEALAASHPAARPLSATAVHNFATCPYKFFLSSIHRLEPRATSEAVELLDPLQKGSLIHDIQFACLSALRERELLPLRPATLERGRRVLDEAVDRVAEEYRERLVPAIERVWLDGIEAIRTDLRRWLRELAEDGSGFVPWRFELAFGLPRRDRQDPDSRAEPVMLEAGGGTVAVRGAIDLVERRESDGALRVTDHKTGRARVSAGAVLDGGSAVQPVLYALAAEKLFPDRSVVSGRLYYCTADGGYRTHEVALDEAARAAMARAMTLVRGEVERGFLPAAPAERACTWCDYRPVCGPWEERRSARKEPSQLRALAELRELR